MKLLYASYIIFLMMLEDKYSKIEKFMFGEIFWLQDFNSFHNFYSLLYKNRIIECRFDKFKRFFAIKDNINFNSNIFDTIAIFLGLIDSKYIAESTFDSMIENGAIIVKEGKKKIFRILGVTEKKNNKIKYNNAESDNKTNLIVSETMLKFGIKLKK